MKISFYHLKPVTAEAVTVPRTLTLDERTRLFLRLSQVTAALIIGSKNDDYVRALTTAAIHCIDLGTEAGYSVTWPKELQDKYYGNAVKPFEKDKVITKLFDMNRKMLMSEITIEQLNAVHSIISYCNMQVNFCGHSMETLIELQYSTQG